MESERGEENTRYFNHRLTVNACVCECGGGLSPSSVHWDLAWGLVVGLSPASVWSSKYRLRSWEVPVLWGTAGVP